MRSAAQRWVIAEGYIPDESMVGADEALISHEAACILNAGDEDAEVEITIFFTDREPAGPYRVTVGARRTRHLRFNDLDDPEPVPRGTRLCQRDRKRPRRSSSSTRGSTAGRRKSR